MFERTQRTIAMAALAGYLLTVTAALPLHRCDAPRTGSASLAVTACTHCHEACGTTTPAGHVTTICADAAEATHGKGDCFVCHLLAQKCIPLPGLSSVGRGEIISEMPVAKPRPAARTPSFAWPIRAPPSVA